MKTKVDSKTLNLTELITACIVAITGVFLLLCGLEVLPFVIGDVWLVATFVCFFAISLAVSLIQKNGIAIAMCWIMGVLAIAQLFVAFGIELRNIYPAYVLAIPLGVANCAAIKGYPSAIIKVSLCLVGVGLLLFLESSRLLTAGVVLPIIVVYLSVMGIGYVAIKMYRRKNKDDQKN
ncbi:MAG: hypothetical protein E7350_04810 [Clostridiales bacterium]|nr:hypothetical protein [Clostridiales bacterium]